VRVLCDGLVACVLLSGGPSRALLLLFSFLPAAAGVPSPCGGGAVRGFALYPCGARVSGALLCGAASRLA
jgi:hypothetical protein